jgi:hypothetical protein
VFSLCSCVEEVKNSLHCILIGIPFWQWDDKDLELQADIDRFVEDEDNVESFLSHDDAEPRDTVGRGMDVSKGAVDLHIILLIMGFMNSIELFV